MIYLFTTFFIIHLQHVKFLIRSQDRISCCFCARFAKEGETASNKLKNKEKQYNAYSNEHYTKIKRTRDKKWWGGTVIIDKSVRGHPLGSQPF